MNIVIVGHGPSLKGKGLGSEIDNFDLVVRLKAAHTVVGSEDYGSRVDVVCMSTEVLGLGAHIKPQMFWLYPKKGTYDKEAVGDFIGRVGVGCVLPLDLVNAWNERFRSLGGKHPNVSTGMAAIIIAAASLAPETIVLAGFDTLTNPDVPFTRNDDIPRTGTGVIDHDWSAENELLKSVSSSYNVSIGKL